MKKKNATPHGMKLSYDITLESGSCRPVQVKFWDESTHDVKFRPEAPFKYMADALVGLSLVQFNSYLKSPIHMPHLNFEFATQAWNSLNPHHHIFERSNDRVTSLGIKPSPKELEFYKSFEQAFTAAFDNLQKPWGIDLSEVSPLLDTLSWLEEKGQSQLLFNFKFQWSPSFRYKLQQFYSFLYNLRSVVAVDLNAHIEDASHEAVKVDAITDYLPKADYVVNDALLYHQFKKLSSPWSDRHRQHINGDHPVDALMVEPMEKAFRKYSFNAVRLIESLPARFLESMNPVELEEALYLVQMDWLLGSDAGLLFRIREELYGVQSGYENLFWQDLETCSHKKAHTLSVCCEIKDHLIHSAQAA